MRRPRKEQGQQTRQKIVDVTTHLFATRGYAGTSLELIAREANTSKSSIFWHFEDKEDLLFTVVDRAMTQWEIAAGSEILAQPDPEKQLNKLFDSYRSLALERPDAVRLLLGLLLETTDANEKVRRRFQKMYQGYRASIGMILEAGLASGHFKSKTPPEHLAAMILALFDGLFVQNFLDSKASPPELFDWVKRSVFDLLHLQAS